MHSYMVTLAYRPDGSGSTLCIPLMAYSEIHACQLAQANYPEMFAIAAVRN
jgi:hypothetical protein